VYVVEEILKKIEHTTSSIFGLEDRTSLNSMVVPMMTQNYKLIPFSSAVQPISTSSLEACQSLSLLQDSFGAFQSSTGTVFNVV
jgi:hypothetical protein